MATPRQPTGTNRGTIAAIALERRSTGADPRGRGTEQEPFSVTSNQSGHTAHLRVFGEIDIATAPILERSLHAAESNGDTAIVIDLEQVSFMDASGLRVFLGAARRASQGGRTLAITRAPARVQRVFRITGTTHLLAADPLPLSQDHHPKSPERASVGESRGLSISV